MSNCYHEWEDIILANIPGWNEYSLGTLFSQRKEKNYPELPLLAVTRNGGVVLRGSLDRRDTSNADKSKYLRVLPGDIAYNTMRMWQGVSGKSDNEGIVSPAYTICIPKKAILPEYVKHLFKLDLLVRVFHRNSQGLVDDTLNMKFNNFSRIKVKIPPLPEQKKIASILTSVDRVTSKTRGQIKKIIDLKKGMMTKLLTVGIGHAEFMDSPVGKIPKNWKVYNVATFIQQRKEKGNETLPIYSVLLNGGMVARSTIDRRLLSELKASDNLKVRKGDLVYNMMRMWQGASGIAPVDCLVSPAYVVTKPNTDIVDSDFLGYLVKSLHGIRLLHRYSYGITGDRLRLYFDSFEKIKFALPPVAEQKQIVQVLKSVDNRLEKKVTKLAQTKSLKKALMNDLLTGKVRVNTTSTAN